MPIAEASLQQVNGRVRGGHFAFHPEKASRTFSDLKPARRGTDILRAARVMHPSAKLERKLAKMYAEHFGLRELPFNNTPDPRFFFATPDHEEALASLVYAVSQRKGYAVLTGEVGAGKTTVGRMMLRRFDNRIASAVINNTYLGADDLLLAICSEFSLEVNSGASRIQMIRTLQDYLLAEFAADRPVVLLLDEAQNLSMEAFEQLRMIGNLEADDAKLLQMIILGQPELRQRFDAPNMRQLKQRVFRSFHLPALSAELCKQYIHHRLAVACESHNQAQSDPASPARTNRIFDDQAIEAIHNFTHGLPRLINTVCDNCLLSAFSDERRTIDGPYARRIIDQLAGREVIAAPPIQPAGGSQMADYLAVIHALEPRLRALELRVEKICSRAEAASGRHRANLPATPSEMLRAPANAPSEQIATHRSEGASASVSTQTGAPRPRISQQLAPAVERLRRIVERSRSSLQLVQFMGAGDESTPGPETKGPPTLSDATPRRFGTLPDRSHGALDGRLGELERLVDQAVG